MFMVNFVILIMLFNNKLKGVIFSLELILTNEENIGEVKTRNPVFPILDRIENRLV